MVPLRADMGIAVEDYTGPCSGVVIANPNAPTGIALGLDAIRKLLDMHPERVVLVDEAYVDFGAQSAVELVRDYPNLLVVQTFSKSRALAGARVGFAFGQPDLIEALVRVKDSFNSYPLDRLAQAGALASVEDEDWFAKSVQRVMDSRTMLSEGLRGLGFEVLPSMANFVYTRHPDRDAGELAAQLRAGPFLSATSRVNAQWRGCALRWERKSSVRPCLMCCATVFFAIRKNCLVIRPAVTALLGPVPRSVRGGFGKAVRY